MRATFREFYEPSADEFDLLWKEGLVVLDTSVIFNLYRYSLATRASMLETLGKFGDRLWLPNRVAHEYHRSRIRVMAQQRSVYSKLKKTVDTFEGAVEKVLQEHSRHPVIEAESTMAVVRTATSEVRRHIEDAEKVHPDLPSDRTPGLTDPIRDELTRMFEGKVGESFSNTDIDLICLQGADRYETLIPPGFKDKGEKTGVDIYGDLIIWKEILRHAKSASLPVIFVTDDQKEDWWQKHEGKTVGPRPELVREIFEEAGVLFHMYQPVQFLERAKERIDDSEFITTDAVSEVKDVSDSETLYLEKIREYRERLLGSISDAERKRRHSEHRLHDLEARIAEEDSRKASRHGMLAREEMDLYRHEQAEVAARRHAVESAEDLPADQKRVMLAELNNMARHLEHRVELAARERWERGPEAGPDRGKQMAMLSSAMKQRDRADAEIADLRAQVAELDSIISDGE